ncbi:Uncharacterized protein Adt_39521 [Abeliophyllum distichum]|uniref:Uncharacterized protein n=1 Tax=Abeliophyllum distichum TaxID=126358 RepID=A0ABD1Q5J2_9LAMI
MRPQGPQFQKPENRVSLEDMFGKFIEKTEQYMKVNNQFMRKNRDHSTKSRRVNKEFEDIDVSNGNRYIRQSTGTLPGNTELNPKEHVKAITTRSEVQLPEVHVKIPKVHCTLRHKFKISDVKLGVTTI